MTPQSEAQPASEKGMVLAPLDDDSRPFADSLLPPEMIYAGADAIDSAHDDLQNYKSGETIDWDSGMIAVAVYRAMTAEVLKSRSAPNLLQGGDEPIVTDGLQGGSSPDAAAPRALPADDVGEILASHLDLQKLIEGGECKPTELAMVAHRHRATLLQQNARLTAELAEAKADLELEKKLDAGLEEESSAIIRTLRTELAEERAKLATIRAETVEDAVMRAFYRWWSLDCRYGLTTTEAADKFRAAIRFELESLQHAEPSERATPQLRSKA